MCLMFRNAEHQQPMRIGAYHDLARDSDAAGQRLRSGVLRMGEGQAAAGKLEPFDGGIAALAAIGAEAG